VTVDPEAFQGAFVTKLAAVLAAAATACATLIPAGLATAGPAAGAVTAAAAVAPATKLVSYHGYALRVPASWPVYRLANDPSRCVLLSTSAVYLGQPGAHQNCPARAIGRATAVLVQPAGGGGGGAALPPGTAVLRAPSAALPSAAALPSVTAAAGSADHVLRLAVPSAGVLVTASYADSQAPARAILASARLTRPAAAAAAGPAATPVASVTPAILPPVRPAAPAPLVRKVGRGLGFDTCTVPSTDTMSSWLASPYRIIGTYLGGANWACGYGNFNQDWVSTVTGQGWRFIPIWVGRQATCFAHKGVVKIAHGQAYQQGRDDASAAITTARAFGYGKGTPLYFDMESYPRNNPACTKDVLNFLGGWTRRLHSAGYKSGVYSSAGSGITDLAARYTVKDYARPDDVWIADWSGRPSLTSPYLTASEWPANHRLVQFYGGHPETWGGVTVNVDSNMARGPVASTAAGAPARPAILTSPDAVTAAPGKSATARLTFTGAASRAVVHWEVTAPDGLTVRAAQGTRTVRPHRTVGVTLTVRAPVTLPSGRYDVAVSATAGGHVLAQTFLLVTVGTADAPPKGLPFLLYAADPVSLRTAATLAKRLDLRITSVTGNFAQAWAAVAKGGKVVVTVGKAAANALAGNPCAWPVPPGPGARAHGMFPAGRPLSAVPAAGVFEAGGAATSKVTGRLLHYALAGTLPGEGAVPSGAVRPTDVCLGSHSVVSS
jgi:hypothetical protein